VSGGRGLIEGRGREGICGHTLLREAEGRPSVKDRYFPTRATAAPLRRDGDVRDEADPKMFSGTKQHVGSISTSFGRVVFTAEMKEAAMYVKKNGEEGSTWKNGSGRRSGRNGRGHV
jgi:hypothetical protein